jgi:glycosyltransferase involved in cell wall biosynthesis
VRVAFYTEADLLGGAEQALGNLIAHLDDGIEAIVVGTDPFVVEHLESRRAGTRAVVVPHVRDKRDLTRFYRLARTFKRLEPDVVHANLTFPTSVKYALPAATLIRVPLVAVENLPAQIENRWQLFVKRRAARRYAAHVTVGEASAREIEGTLALPRGSVEVIYNGVEDFQVERRPSADGPVIGTVARYTDQKGLDVLLRAVPDVPGARFVLVGDGPDRGALEALAAELGVAERVEFAGWTEDARGELGRFDVFVLPSRYEGLPLALIDSMLAALPVVASRVGSIPEAVEDGEHGLLVPPEDPAALAAALHRVLGDEPLRQRLGSAARSVAVARFTVEAMAHRYQRLYERVTGA